MKLSNLSLILILALLFSNFLLYAQDSAATYAGRYLDHRTDALDRYAGHAEKIQQRLLKRLKRKEAKFLRKLAKKDSTLYQSYINQGMDYDSIAALSKDTAHLSKLASHKNTLLDSLKGVQNFLQKQSSSVSGNLPTGGYTGQLTALQQKLNAQQSINALISKRTAALESTAGAAKIGGLQGLQKNVYYAQEKIKAWKELSDDPDAAEQEALEYLEGTKGFSKYIKGDNQAFGGLSGSNVTTADLQRMGYQTKGQVNARLQQQAGGSLDGLQEQMAAQVQQYTDKLGGVSNKLNPAKSSIGRARQTASEAKQSLSEAKQAASQVKQLEKPAFKKNPERGKPFWQRLEIQYNFQTARSTPDGLRPAMLDLGAAVAFKHTPRLSYGIGAGLSTGMGKDWQNIRLTYEGITARAYADYKMIYGFSFQAGYERSFRPAGRPYLPQQPYDNNNNDLSQTGNALKDAFGGQQQAAYAGIMKRYSLGGKWNGTLLIGYNFLWQSEGMRSPFMVRLGYGK